MKWLEIDMDDSVEKWDAFYREIETAVLGSPPAPVPPGVGTEMLSFLHHAWWAEGVREEKAVEDADPPSPADGSRSL